METSSGKYTFALLENFVEAQICRAGLTMVPNVPWHRAPRRKGALRATKKILLGYLIVIYIGNCLTSLFFELTTSYIETYYKNLRDSWRSNVLAVCIVCLGWLH